MIGIVSYGIGNIGSVANILDASEISYRYLTSPADFSEVDRIILPGVGAFDAAMRKLCDSGLRETLDEAVRVRQVPVLGLCLGMHMMFDGSDEGTETGLGWLPGRIVAFDRTRLGSRFPVPHMSWASVRESRPSLFSDALRTPARFYFAHSFHLDPTALEVALGEATYGYPFPAVVGRGRVVGVQFHPEKSRHFGAALLKAFSAAEFA